MRTRSRKCKERHKSRFQRGWRPLTGDFLCSTLVPTRVTAAIRPLSASLSAGTVCTCSLRVSGSVAPSHRRALIISPLVCRSCYQSALTRTELNRYSQYWGFGCAALQPLLCLYAASIRRRRLLRIQSQQDMEIKAEESKANEEHRLMWDGP